MLPIALRVAHITLAALWLAYPVGMVRSLRRGRETSPEAFALACQDARRRGSLAGMMGVLTIASGMMLIFSVGGFNAVSNLILVGLALSVLALLMGGVVSRPALEQLLALSQAPDPPPAKEIDDLLSQLSSITGIIRGLWLLILVLMVAR